MGETGEWRKREGDEIRVDRGRENGREGRKGRRRREKGGGRREIDTPCNPHLIMIMTLLGF